MTPILLQASPGVMPGVLESLANTLGMDLFEEEIDDVIFKTNEFLTDATFIGSQGPFWWILEMCMALGATFSIIMAAGMAYKMMVKGEAFDVLKILRVLGIAIVMFCWYPGGSAGDASVLGMLSYIPNCIGSYTHDLYEAEAYQVQQKFDALTPLIAVRDSMARDAAVEADLAYFPAKQNGSEMDGIEAKDIVQQGKDSGQIVWRSSYTGLMVCLDKIVMLLSLVIFRIGWWGTIYCQQILLGMLTIFGPLQWAFSILPKWEGAWAKWITRYLTVHFYGAMLYFVGYFYNLTHSVSIRLHSNIQHMQQTCTKIAIKKSNEGGAKAYWQVGIEKMNVFLFRLSSHLSLVWSCFLSNICPRISSCFGLIIWHKAVMFDIFSNRRQSHSLELLSMIIGSKSYSNDNYN